MKLFSYHHISKFSKDLKQNVSIWITPTYRWDPTKILVYEKGGVIKHVETPAINKVELLDLWKNGPRDDVE